MNNDSTNLMESIIVKLQAHANYILPRMKDKEEKLQATVTFETILDHVVFARKPIAPEQIRGLAYVVADSATHKKVLDTYEDIYYNMHKRFYGRSEDAYLEKL